MNLILLTILLTLLSSGLIVLLVWLSITAYKVTKFKKCTLSRLRSIDESITTSYNNMYDHANNIDAHINKRIDEMYDIILKASIELDKRLEKTNAKNEATINQIYVDINKNKDVIKNKMEKIYTDINRNQDGVYNNINENYTNLSNKINSTYDELSNKIENDAEPSFIFNTEKKKKKKK